MIFNQQAVGGSGGGGGASRYVVGIDYDVSIVYWFSVTPAACSEGDTVTVKYEDTVSKPLEPMKALGITDLDGTTLAVLSTAMKINYGDTFTFSMPAQDVLLSLVEVM